VDYSFPSSEIRIPAFLISLLKKFWCAFPKQLAPSIAVARPLLFFRVIREIRSALYPVFLIS